MAQGTRRSPADVERQINPAVRWLTTRLEPGLPDGERDATPIVAQEYVDRLRSNIVRELEACDSLDGRDVVRAMRLLDELADAWKRTDRGKFMARLTGSESASAVVAIAHDIRSPLSSILILVDSLRRGHGALLSSIQDRQLGLIYGATHGLATLASDLIDAARGEALLDERALPFSIMETMDSVRAILLPIAEEKGLALQLENPVTDARLGYPAQLHRVLLNLACNALRYTDTGTVTVGCRPRSEGRLAFWVEDTGRGLPGDIRETMFEAFRPEQIALRFSSSGLGLATVRALLTAMGTDLDVQTCEGGGTRFSFQLELPPAY